MDTIYVETILHGLITMTTDKIIAIRQYKDNLVAYMVVYEKKKYMISREEYIAVAHHLLFNAHHIIVSKPNTTYTLFPNSPYINKLKGTILWR